MTWNLAADIATALGGLIAVVSVPAALITHRQSVRTRRAGWLAALHEKFFESGRYDRVPRILDYREDQQ
jgi:hypothetical protein